MISWPGDKLTKSSSAVFDGIILSAGLSSRFNSWKPAHILENKPLICHTIDSMLPCCRSVCIVGGHNFQRLKDLLKDRYNEEITDGRLHAEENRNFLSGMFSSVRCGLKSLGDDAEGYFIIPADMPFVLSDTYKALISCFTQNRFPDAVIPVIGGRKGHPVVISAALRDKILKADDSGMLRSFIISSRYKLCPVGDKGILEDIDHIDDIVRKTHRADKA